jgi:hypothetical protein
MLTHAQESTLMQRLDVLKAELREKQALLLESEQALNAAAEQALVLQRALDTGADALQATTRDLHEAGMQHADVCWRMLAYAGVCWRMLTYAGV